MRILANVACATVLLVVGPSLASAQVTLTLDLQEYTYKEEMVVTVTIPQGTRAEKPRFCFLRDGKPLPKRDSPQWIDFPAFTTSQKLKLRAPDNQDVEGWPGFGEGWWLARYSWSLLLYDGTRLIARVPFEIVHALAKLERVRERLQRELAEGEATRLGAGSAKGLMALVTLKEPSLGDRFEVVVTIPDVRPGDAQTASLQWGHTADLPWDEKERAPESRDFPRSVQVPQPIAGKHTLSVNAPFVRAGRFDLRLFQGATLIDVLTITVK